MLKLIASVDENWGIGLGQSLLFHIPEDLQWFKSHTVGKTVLLGRKTLESLPGGKPLPNRKHLLLSRTVQTYEGDVTVCPTVEEALRLAEREPEVWVIGGEQVYELLLPHCEEALITKVRAAGGADKYLPNLDEAPQWQLQKQTPWQSSHGVSFCFCQYLRRK